MMELKVDSCSVSLQIVQCGLLPLRSQTARKISTSMGRWGLRKKFTCLAVRGSSGDDHELDSGRWSRVDADMISLRKRMYQLKQQESNYEYPQEWKEWEKKCHRRYHSDVFQALECLQCSLINARPRDAIAVLSLVAASISASAIILLSTVASYLTVLLSNGNA